MKIIIELQRCRDCRYYNKTVSKDLLEGIAKNMVRQLNDISVTVSSNREHIRRIYLQK